MTTEEFVALMIKWGNFKARCKSNFAKTETAKRNRELEDKYKGKRCFIIGNGPSIRNQNLSLLADEVVFVVNDFYRYDEYQKIRPDYYVLADPFFFRPDTGPMLLSGIEKIKGYDYKPAFIIPYETEKVVHDVYKWDKWTTVYYYDGAMAFEDGYTKKWDMTETVMSAQNVVQIAMLAATYMGVKEIYLLGIEQTDIIGYLESYLNNGMIQYAYEVDDDLRKVSSIGRAEISIEETLKGYVRIFHLYKEIYHFCQVQGINVYNCTPVSLVNCIPQKQYEDLFKGRL